MNIEAGLTRIGRAIPQPLERALRGSIIEAAYQRLRIRRLAYETIQLDTTNGSATLDIPLGRDCIEEMRADNYEPQLSSQLDTYVSTDSSVYDIGSRFGYFPVRLSPTGADIHAFEAENVRYHVLEHNASAHENITAVNALVGTQDDMLSIDDYAQTNADPTVVKIDVEGAELNVLESMVETISRARPRLYVEVHPHLLDTFDATTADVLAFLRSREYSVQTFDHRSDGVDTENIPDSPFLAVAAP